MEHSSTCKGWEEANSVSIVAWKKCPLSYLHDHLLPLLYQTLLIVFKLLLQQQPLRMGLCSGQPKAGCGPAWEQHHGCSLGLCTSNRPRPKKEGSLMLSFKSQWSINKKKMNLPQALSDITQR